MNPDEGKTELLKSSIDSNTTITDLTDDLPTVVPQLAVPEKLLITTILEESNSNRNVEEVDTGNTSKSLDNISASRTLTNHNRKSSPNAIDIANDTKSSLSNYDRGDTSILSGSATQLLLMQLMLQWKENKNHIDGLMKKSLELSRTIQESIEPNEVIVKMREKEKENQMLQLLVRQYESTLDIVMKKFRTQTSLIHDRKIREQTELETALELERAENERLIGENTLLRTRLEECTKAMREALASLDHTPSTNPISHLSTYLSNTSLLESTALNVQRRNSE